MWEHSFSLRIGEPCIKELESGHIRGEDRCASFKVEGKPFGPGLYGWEVP